MPDEAKLVEYLKRVTADLVQTRQRLAEVEEQSHEPIAIVGMGCRFPGGVRGPEDLWRLVAAGTDAVGPFPADRGWDVEALYDPEPGKLGTSNAREGGFLYDVAGFDADFFGISPREALAMDPQQRLLLEVAWETLERAGIPPARLRGSRTGVFAGIVWHDYATRVQQPPPEVAGYLVTGGMASIASGRIAYTLGLEGPAITVDTGCSSSLVTMHLAAQALRRRECDLAFAGGATTMATPGAFIEFTRQRGLARDGRCKSFAAAADGAGWAEGAGLVLLERLADAQRNGHPVLAVVRGSAINQDGASSQLSAPNGPSQQRVIRDALADARLTPHDVDVVEAHGTGTTLGDPIEAQAVIATYGSDRLPDRPLWLGSVKSNIGHTQAAAGVAGVIKMVMALRHGSLPRTLHVDRPTPHVDWSAGSVSLLTERVPWPGTDRPRRAGVSSFGISGTNAHLILEQAPAVAAPAPREAGGPLVWPLSGRTGADLRAQAERLRSHLAGHPGLDPADVAWSLAVTRTHHERRAAVVGGGREDLIRGLDALADGEPAPGLVEGSAAGAGRTVFVFPGQGSHWPGMAAGLLATDAVFADAVRQCEDALAPYVDWSLTDLLRRGEPLTRVDVVQPALFAVMVSLAALWRHHGVEPDAVIGHSQGEIAAAHVAGALSLTDAAKICALRSRALLSLSGTGGMAAVALAPGVLAARLTGDLHIASVNGPASTVVSGDPVALDELVRVLSDEGVRARLIPVDYASHCSHVDAVRDELRTALAGISPRPSGIPFYSTVTGGVLDTAGLDEDYWFRNLRRPVEFLTGTRALAADGHRTFIECSPHPVLTGAIEDAVDGAVAVGTLRRDEGDRAQFLRAVAAAHTTGTDVRWAALLPAGAGAVELPTYPFRHQTFWLEGTAAAGDLTAAGLHSSSHPLVGAFVAMADGAGLVFTGRLAIDSHPWLAEHAVTGRVLLPGTAFAEIALHVGEQAGCAYVDELTLHAPLVLPAEESVQIQVIVAAPGSDGRRTATIHAQSADTAAGWTHHASADLSAATGTARDADVRPPAGARELDVAALGHRLAERGYDFGPAFRSLRGVWITDDDVYGEVTLPEQYHAEAERFHLHPALLDSALQAVAAGQTEETGVRLPFAFTGLQVFSPGATSLRVRARRTGTDVALTATDPAGRLVATLRAVTMRPVDPGTLGGGGEGSLYRLDWIDLPVPADQPSIRECAVLGTDDTGLVPALTDGGVTVTAHPDLTSVPPGVDLVVVEGQAPASTDPAAAAHAAAQRMLATIQAWLARGDTDDGRLIVVTRDAVAARPGDHVGNLAAAPLWGLVRSAQTEHPGRLTVIDVDHQPSSLAMVAVVAGTGEPQAAIRAGRVMVPRIAAGAGTLAPPEGPWRLDTTDHSSLDGLAFVPNPEAAAELGPGQVRVAVRAVGVNFRDTLIALNVYPGAARLGNEGAGVVAETGPGVADLRPGDRVMGLFPDGIGPTAVTDHRHLVRIPHGWSFPEAASAPIAFATAYYGLADLAGVREGDRLLVHSAAGGVGMAATQLARLWRAEVFGTAHPHKWARVDVDDDHLASSRTTEFESRFRPGVDVVLNSLAGEFTDASLRLLGPGGRFIDLSRTDLRDAGDVAAAHAGVAYRSFDLTDPGPERLHEILTTLAGLFEAGDLRPLPVTAFDIRQAPEAFRHISMGLHVGKVVLTVPRPLDPDGTVLITGGTGMAGSLLARDLVTRGARHLLLAGRQGPAAAAAADLAALPAEVTVVACDTTDRDAVAAMLAAIPAEHPLTAVIHAAGTVDDGTVEALEPERLDAVLRPKVTAAWLLHQLTRDADLAVFVLFSSLSGVLGTAGQANYAAANTFLDALARHRQARGLPGTALAWGYWEQASDLTGHLGARDLARGGVAGMPGDRAVELFHDAVSSGRALCIPARFDPIALRSAEMPSVLSGLKRAPAATEASLAQRLSQEPAQERVRILLQLVTTHAAAVLGHGDSTAVPADRQFKDLGFDSLTAVELRNRLRGATGLRLPSTLVFDLPTPAAVAQNLESQLAGRAEPAATGAVRATPAGPGGADEPIAVVAVGCRFPGGVRTPADLWRLMSEGVDAIGGFPSDRGWDTRTLFSADPDDPGTSYVDVGGFLEDAGEFDAAFFGIAPNEALAMDPQQRLLLETAWETLERAGIDPAGLHGSNTGVYLGVVAQEYAPGLGARLPDGIEGHFATGITTSVASGRLAYSFGLQGPAVTVDTACSSSLVAVHQACQALRQGECDLTITGGATVMANPRVFIEFSRQRGLATDGRCKSFADTADGFGVAEGAGLLLLERLSDAQRNNHPILAVIRGSAVNQDGASNGLTAPNGPSQQRVIRQALANAGLSPADVDAVEAHGTGTTLGDPIEAQALLATYGADRPADRPLWLGTIKSNIGHTQAAAGVAGIIKMVQALNHEVLPQTLHVDEPSSHIDWDSGAVALLTEAQPWIRSTKPRRAGVSSFGISGTNAHLILEEPPTTDEKPADGPFIWPLSAKTPEALRDYALRLRDTDADPADIAHTLAGRTHFEHRAAIVGTTHDDLTTGLQNLIDGTHPITATARPGKTVFVFPGQGSQWAGMATDLLQNEPVFAEHMQACAAALQPHIDWNLFDALTDPDLLERVDVVQPTLFAVMVSLARLWQHHNIHPDAVIGHSQGEIAATHIAGALTLADAATVSALRAKTLTTLTGAMASIALPADQLNLPADLHVAAHNSDTSTVIAGPAEAITAYLEQCTVHSRRIPVSYASHSPQVEPLREDILTALADITPQPTEIPLYSTRTTQPIDGTDLTAQYWYDNLRHPVMFHQTITRLHDDGHTHYIECSPHPVLPATTIPTLSREQGFTTALATAHTHGLTPTWNHSGRQVELPTYPFQREHYWLTPPATLLGEPTTLADDSGLLFTGDISPHTHPWLADHSVGGTVVVPGSAFVEAALHAGRHAGRPRVEELTLHRPLTVPDDATVRLQARLTGDELTVHASLDGQTWTHHGTATLGEAVGVVADGTEPPPGLPVLDIAELYRNLGERGVRYGDAFRCVRSAAYDGADLYATVTLPVPPDGFVIHPALLDGALHGLVSFYLDSDGMRMPFVWSGIEVAAVGATTLHVHLERTGPDSAALTATDPAGDPVLSIDGIVLRLVEAARPQAIPVPDGVVPAKTSRPAPRRAAAAGAPASLADRIAALAEPEQHRVLLDAVRSHAAAALGHTDSERVGAHLPFKDLGFDSMMAVGLRNRLADATGLSLPATLAFDRPDPESLARHLRELLVGGDARPARRAGARKRADEPVAVVAMGCRFPGGVRSPEELWRLLADGVDAVGEFPADRGWDIEALFDPEPGRPGKTYTRSGGFLDRAGAFDAGFFGISPREALAMDPQQRLLLETAWETVERAGIDPTSLRGSDTGVFAGVIHSGYGSGAVPEDVEGYVMTGGLTSVASGRLAYALGLQGPAVTVDTACSSSLVAMHQAIQALRNGECSLALTGGCTVIVTPAGFLEFSRQRGLAADGRCKSFADGADGTGWAEGAGLVLLERLSDARRNGHPVLAVIRGSAINQDGASNGLTAPNGPAQERVIRQALEAARLTEDDVDAVEAHGTGTTLGDPIEAQALLATYGAGRPADRPLWLGSIKSNFGHTGAAAGVAGVIKMVLALRHGLLPRTLHVDRPSSHIDWDSGAVALLTEPQPWTRGSDRPRRAGVSSFGISGTNAHLIIEEPPPAPAQPAPAVAGPLIWPLSAKTPEALRDYAGRLRDTGADLTDIAHTLNTRAHFEHRAAIVGTSREDLVSGLTALAEGTPVPHLVTGRARPGGKTVFVFPGQGSQWTGMTTTLLRHEPVFAEHMRACAEALRPHTDWDLFDALTDPDLLARVDVVQPTLFAVMVSLARLWQHHDVQPDAVIGHSQGEIAAAHIAGALTLTDAAAVSALRAKSLTTLTGAMASVALPADQLNLPPDLHVAAHNSPASTVIAGPAEAITTYLEHCTAHTRRIPVTYASHSPHVEPLQESITTALAGITPQPTDIPLYSTRTAQPIDGTELTADYWYANLRHPVLFHQTITRLHDDGHTHYVECSPHPVLLPAIQDTATGATTVATLHRDEDSAQDLATALATAHTRGLAPTWGVAGRTVELPTYPFQHQHYWLTPAGRTASGTGHPLLESETPLAEGGGGGVLLSGRVSLATHPWLADHAVLDTVLLPGTAFLEMALHAARDTEQSTVHELVLHAPLSLPEKGTVHLQAVLGAVDGTNSRTLTIHSTRDHEEWTQHATATLVAGHPAAGSEATPPTGATPLDVAGLYPKLADDGYRYGPAFQGLTAAWRQGDDLYATVDLPTDRHDDRFRIHPALLDAALHVLALRETGQEIKLPFSWSDVTLHATDSTTLHVRAEPAGEDRVRLVAVDGQGRLVISGSVVLRTVDPAVLNGSTPTGVGRWVYEVQWAPVTSAPTTSEAGGFRLFDDVNPWNLDTSDPGDDTILICAGTTDDILTQAHTLAERALHAVQQWLHTTDTGRLVVVTRGAVPTRPGEHLHDLAAATVWGLIRSAQTEHPGRILLIDLDPTEDPTDPATTPTRTLRTAIATAHTGGEPQIAIRDTTPLAPRLTKAADDTLAIPDSAWKLATTTPGTLTGLTLTSDPDAHRPLQPGEVRIRLHAAGLNFRDALIALDQYAGENPTERPTGAIALGSEGAGTILDIGPGVTGLHPGDRVMGLIPHIAATTVTDHRLITPIPEHWTYPQAATACVAYLTAYYGLHHIAHLRPGEKLLIHSAAGGVGTAAHNLVRHHNAHDDYDVQVYATAHPRKWATVDLPASHLASTRTLDFEVAFQPGVDVILNTLAGAHTDASLRLLNPGGRLAELSKTDLRNPHELATTHPHLTYQPYDLNDAGPDRIQQILTTLRPRFADDTLPPLPVTNYDIRQAAHALRHLAQSRHTGKITLTVPTPPHPAGTTLITGGTGTIGSHLTSHLIDRGHHHLHLASRRGPHAATALDLQHHAAARDAHLSITACDTTDPDQLAQLLASIDPGHPLTHVIHATGHLDDATVTNLTADRLHTVLTAKIDPAYHLHRHTRHSHRTHTTLISSLAGTLGAAGQGNYAAANTFLDALAHQAHTTGHPTTSLAFGYWHQPTGMTQHLTTTDHQRLTRAGSTALTTAQGLALYTATHQAGKPFLVPTRFDVAALRRSAAAGTLHPILRSLAGGAVRRATAGSAGPEPLAEALLKMSEQEQVHHLLTVVQSHTATVLGHSDPGAIQADEPFKNHGIDSLTAIELRNRLATTTGIALPATLTFDHPTPHALAAHIRTLLAPEQQDPATAVRSRLDHLDATLSTLAEALADEAERARVADRLRRLTRKWQEPHAPGGTDGGLATASDDELFDFLDRRIGAHEGNGSSARSGDRSGQ